ncbi:MAG TPA: ATP-binding protein [Ramlibacter sp.]|uniref:sensor histidine kinase n=1 Tax=Ramlibacter sp. TaxID=1917967 RepID=UPI002BC79774|nr:ATP-binding protein [Ramlibacter sp.]HVZ45557.1 ATP-binding protein [Ramlibacter sp.]
MTTWSGFAPDSVDLPDAVADDSAFMRMWRAFMSARVTIAVALLVLLGLLYGLGIARGGNAGWLMGLCATYLAASLAVRVFTRPLPPGHAFDPQWVSTIGIDLLAFSTLQFLQAGGISYLPLFALPVLTAGVLGSSLLAMGAAAAVTLLLLGDAWLWSLHVPEEMASRFLQAGLTGIGYFAVALLANQLSVRLAREEHEARRSRMAARTQAQVNELVVEHLGDGVLVVGGEGQVHIANPAARRLLGCEGEALEMPFALGSRDAWRPLMELARRTLADHESQRSEIALVAAPGERHLVNVRTRMTPPQGQSQDLCVMFLEDLREVEARLRTEKLAAMGRMSAAVAHEIRNPLAAISQANALLEEELTDESHRQLSQLVRQNARRLSHIVEEILDITRVEQQLAAPLVLDDAVGATVDDWVRQMQAAERLHLDLASRVARVAFQPEHLRRVLVNLLDNALRYAGGEPDSIRVATEDGAEAAWLRVWSDGLPLEQGVQRHLFEPFFSSESRSSGLGLYICRELCERHGASIGYRRTSAVEGGREGNEFFVRFQRREAAADDALPFDTITA